MQIVWSATKWNLGSGTADKLNNIEANTSLELTYESKSLCAEGIYLLADLLMDKSDIFSLSLTSAEWERAGTTYFA